MNTSDPPRQRLSRAEIEQRQVERLHGLLRLLVPSNTFWTEKFRSAGVDVDTITSRDDLAGLPFTTKSELTRDQLEHPPYGSNLTDDLSAYSRMHQTSGTTGEPLRWLDTPASWKWFLGCWEQIFQMVGLEPEDRLFFPFSFGPFIGFWAAFEGANRLANLCIAGGGMSSVSRLRMMEENQVSIVCCTPTYALRLAEVAAEEGIDLASGSVRALVVAGEPGGNIPATRGRIETAWGARVFDHWGMTELGALAVETRDESGGLRVLETECIAEIVDTETLRPVPPGTPGELVVTNLGRSGSPLIRYRTGDLVIADAEPPASDLAGELLRLDGGILGRVDEMLTIRGNNVFPSSLEAILRGFEEIAEYRIEVETRRAMQHVKIEIEPTSQAASPVLRDELLGKVSRQIKDRLNFQAEVFAVQPGSLPRFELKARRFFRRENL